MNTNHLKKVYKKEIFDQRDKSIVITFDLDKTYLDTEFETISGLIKIPFETANEKKNIPGSDSLVRELRKTDSNLPRALFFISGSPTRMESVIRKKLEIDGVQFDGILLKNFSAAIRKFQFKKLIDKVGFKLSALLYGRSVFPLTAREILFGDDSEYDATIYSLYSDILQGKIDAQDLKRILEKWRIYKDEIDLIQYTFHHLFESGWEPKKAVEKIFIHMETGSTPRDFFTFSNHIIPTYNYFQTSLLLQKDNYFTRFGAYRIISDLINHYNFKTTEFQQSLEDLILRDMIEIKEARKILKMIQKTDKEKKQNLFLPDIVLQFKNIIKNAYKMKTRIPRNIFARNHQMAPLDKYLSIQLERRV